MLGFALHLLLLLHAVEAKNCPGGLLPCYPLHTADL